MAGRSTQLSRGFLFVLTSALILSFISGLGLWYVHEQREKLAELPRWTWLCQTTHGLLNPLIAVQFGWMVTHISGGWRMRVNRKSGGSVTVMLAVLIATGAALYYFADRHVYFTIHLLAGLLLPFCFGFHWLQARKWVRSVSEK